ncbi:MULTISPECIES: nucleoside-diphosphate sugar epimerase/dehydratase [unclassified Sphingomonas]|uniref:polysaccharide biosynthesis protein n=1 Tax=unclassified Sphingomonas TaxID=196159 RepID=UPI0028622217|nr:MULTISPECIES: nucleoside-diphosphate sugar epimerase/dehydratase [unclassified Sphingomonas]MDR6116792.1 FlaA1/EpsC-like NDP-sugar epimerase [Sphingomonas sp. SORGH_AS_0789]MDR6151870.1 FlaA1/EpsC-like NDP-sugar epimerase [Sphingomonas sp. SORGH_AS_0742]
MTVAVSVSERILALPRPAKKLIVLAGDALLCAASVHIAYYLRTNEWAPLFGPTAYAVVTAILLALPIFIVLGLYRAIFRYTGNAAMLTITKAVAIYSIPYFLIYTYIGIPGVPRTLGLLQPIVLLLLVVGFRATAGGWLGYSYRSGDAGRSMAKNMPRVLIYGAGFSGRQVASALQLSGQVHVLGFVDDDRSLWKATINGQRVYSPTEIDLLRDRKGATDVLLAINKASRARRNEIITQLKRSGMHVRAVPGVDQLATGSVSFSDLKELEIEDLLGRAPIPPDQGLLQRNITGKVVLVTGAGGSIGSEICRQIARLSPEILLIVDSSEYNLYAIHQELLRSMAAGTANVHHLVPLLATVRDYRRIDEIIATWRPYTIYHAAAYKHVPLVEHNILEGLANNVLGTLNVATAARVHGVASFVLISTDKAVRPTNVMGATKRLAEIIIQALHADGTAGQFCMVRFGNVLGSSGSVVPLFRSQIAAGGPITITDPEITRYFMTIPEAAQLVIQAGAMAQGGDVFVLDMGDPVRIVDLARSMIELSGLRVREEGSVDGDIAIEYVGLRPGEKLYEELLIGNSPSPSGHARILRANEPFIDWNILRDAVAELQQMIECGDSEAARELLLKLVVEFSPTSPLVDFVTLRQEENKAGLPPC